MFSNPLSFIDPSGMGGVGSDGYSEISVRNVTGAIGFAYFGSDGGPSEDPAISKSGRVPGAPEVQDRQIASSMPENIAFGIGAYNGLKQTGQFLSGLTTIQGWKDLGQGFINLGKMSNHFDLDGTMMRFQMVKAAYTYTKNIPDMTSGEIAYDLGYGSEKVAEAILTRKVMPVSKASMGLKVLGKANKMTTPIGIAMQGKFGKLPFRVPTPLNGWGKMSNDIGSVLSRNTVIPLGRIMPFQYIQSKNK